MITKKIIVTNIIVNSLKVDVDGNTVTYWIGNDIERVLGLDSSISLGENILKYENLLNLENSDTGKELYWYNGVTALITHRDSFSGRINAWFNVIS